MQTLTADQFKQKYGVIAASQFDIADKKKQNEESLFDSIKSDFAVNTQNSKQLMNSGDTSPLGTVSRGVGIAANSLATPFEAAGEGLSRIPVVGGALKAIGGGIKGAYDSVVNKLGDTKFMQEAATGLEKDSNLEKGLNIASGGGKIAGDILAADVGTGALSKGTGVVKGLSAKVGEGLDSIPKPDLGAAGNYVKGAIRDVVPNRQRVIDEMVAKGLDLTPGDLANIESKTGNPVGEWLAQNNLIGKNKSITQGSIKSFLDTNYQAVRNEIGKVQTDYKLNQVPGYYDALKQVKQTVEGVPGLEETLSQVDNLMTKPTIKLADVQTAKELIDDYYKLYDATGDVVQNASKEGMANIRTKLQTFIEDQVEKNGGQDIRLMNKNVSTAKSLDNAITKRDPRGLTRNNFTQRDVMIGLGLTYLNPVLGIGAMFLIKLAKSPTARLRFARFLDKQSDAAKAKISQTLSEGKVPAEAEKVVGPINENSVSQIQPQ